MARIKLGISLKSLALPFRRSLPLAQKLGAQGVELEAIGELTPKNLTQTGRREITHLLRSHDLSVSAIVCPLRRGLGAGILELIVGDALHEREDVTASRLTLAGHELIITGLPLGCGSHAPR